MGDMRKSGWRRTLAMLALLPVFATAAPVDTDHLTVELVAESTALAPGKPAWLALRLKHDPHWHTYWTNPGDSGLATKFAWRAPAGYAIGDIAWPAPARLRVGELHNFGYDDEMLLPVQVAVPADAKPGERAAFALDANWLVCEEECIPGKASLALELPIDAAPQPDPRWQSLFAAAHAAQPRAATWTGAATAHGDAVEIRLTGADLPPLDALDLFAVPEQVLANTAPTFTRDGDALVAKAARSEYFSKVPETLDLVVVSRADGVRAWRTQVAWRDTGAAAPVVAATATPPAPSFDGGLAFALVFALLGGVLLNLMPCVFPVLSLKALGLAEGAHDRAAARRDALAYLAGAVAGFVALAAVLLALRGAGQGLGWGFQLQSPTLVAALVYLMLAMGLSLSGVFVVGARLAGTGQRLTEGGGVRAAFFTGVLACIVASPCTAPFMGPALGYALTQPAWAALAVFAALGVGLALPVALLGFVPVLAHWLPKPGAWMETLKQVLAFPLYLTAVWLFWVLMRQVGPDGAALVLAGAVVLIGALVWYGRAQFGAPLWWRHVAIAALVLVALAPLAGLAPQTDARAESAGATWQAWNVERLDALRKEGRPVLVNMTAAWCITCLANERVALSSDAFRDALKTSDAQYLKGDWTSQDAAITQYLAGFGRSGVPLYVVYPRGGGEPEVLPQILTPGLVADALARAAAGSVTPATRSSP